jgi:hypothetical protein
LCERIRRWFVATGEAAFEQPSPAEDISDALPEFDRVNSLVVVHQRVEPALAVRRATTGMRLGAPGSHGTMTAESSE